MNASIVYITLSIISYLSAEGFFPGTLVKTVQGYQRIENLTVGEQVIGTNFLGATLELPIVSITKQKTNSTVFLIIGDTLLRVAPNQKFFLAHEKKWIQARHLKPGDNLLKECTQITEVKFIKELPCKGELYDITVQNYHNFCVSKDTIHVHNFLPIYLGITVIYTIGEGLAFEAAVSLGPLVIGALLYTCLKGDKKNSASPSVDKSPHSFNQTIHSYDSRPCNILNTRTDSHGATHIVGNDTILSPHSIEKSSSQRRAPQLSTSPEIDNGFLTNSGLASKKQKDTQDKDTYTRAFIFDNNEYYAIQNPAFIISPHNNPILAPRASKINPGPPQVLCTKKRNNNKKEYVSKHFDQLIELAEKIANEKLQQSEPGASEYETTQGQILCLKSIQKRKVYTQNQKNSSKRSKDLATGILDELNNELQNRYCNLDSLKHIASHCLIEAAICYTFPQIYFPYKLLRAGYSFYQQSKTLIDDAQTLTDALTKHDSYTAGRFIAKNYMNAYHAFGTAQRFSSTSGAYLKRQTHYVSLGASPSLGKLAKALAAPGTPSFIKKLENLSRKSKPPASTSYTRPAKSQDLRLLHTTQEPSIGKRKSFEKPCSQENAEVCLPGYGTISMPITGTANVSKPHTTSLQRPGILATHNFINSSNNKLRSSEISRRGTINDGNSKISDQRNNSKKISPPSRHDPLKSCGDKQSLKKKQQQKEKQRDRKIYKTNTTLEVSKEEPSNRRSINKQPHEQRRIASHETILAQKDFQITNRQVQGARVYKRDNFYYHLDKLHKGKSAHLEVYDKRGNHIGIADIHTGELLPGTKVAGRKIDV